MKKNILNKKINIDKKFASVVIFFSVLIISQLLISSFRFINNEQNKFFSTLNTTKKYVTKHENELREDVFNKLFKKSERCNLIDSTDLRKNCFQDISHTLALIIKEEEFSYWPSDIFFVKRTENQLFKLGWSGELTTIKTFSNIKVLNHNESPFNDFIFHKCNYFGTADSIAPSCEIFTKFKLNNNEEGYVVRSVGFTDDDDFIFYLLIPFFVLFGILTSLSLPREIEYYIELLIGLFPLIIGFIVVKLFNKNKKK